MFGALCIPLVLQVVRIIMITIKKKNTLNYTIIIVIYFVVFLR